MGNNPLAALSSTERRHYRNALTAHVVEVIYRFWQRNHGATTDDLVDGVRAMREDAPLAEVHRAVASLECSGMITQLPGSDGHWHRVEHPAPLPRPLRVCSTRGCLRPDDHPDEHLPDLHGEQLSAQLTVVHDDFFAVWHQGAPWIHVYPDAAAWQAGGSLVATLVVPHELRFVPDTIVEVVTAWLGSDEYPAPPDTGTRSHHEFVFTPGVETGTLVLLHADYFAAWNHDKGEVAFYDVVTDWDEGLPPLDVVAVPDGEPFTGAVLDQLAEEWYERRYPASPANDLTAGTGNVKETG
jgi:hypothetical protein